MLKSFSESLLQFSDSQEYMCDEHLKYFRNKLLRWKEELRKELSITMDELRNEDTNEPDINDRASLEIERGIELRKKSRLRKLIEKIDVALLKIEKGQYGYCEETGEPIGINRLNARPIATLCIEAQEKHEKFEKDHNEDV